jgi:hypothetical protein
VKRECKGCGFNSFASIAPPTLLQQQPKQKARLIAPGLFSLFHRLSPRQSVFERRECGVRKENASNKNESLGLDSSRPGKALVIQRLFEIGDDVFLVLEADR